MATEGIAGMSDDSDADAPETPFDRLRQRSHRAAPLRIDQITPAPDAASNSDDSNEPTWWQKFFTKLRQLIGFEPS